MNESPRLTKREFGDKIGSCAARSGIQFPPIFRGTRFAVSYRRIKRHTVCSSLFLGKLTQIRAPALFHELELWCIV
jgi:hypothetical protein